MGVLFILEGRLSLHRISDLLFSPGFQELPGRRVGPFEFTKAVQSSFGTQTATAQGLMQHWHTN